MYYLFLANISIALLTGSKFDDWKIDDHLLIKALKEEQIEATSVVWDAPRENWSEFNAVVVFSTWDYYEDKYELFLETIENIEKQNILVYNCFETIKWNSSKEYLKQLSEKGIKTIESIWLEPAELKNLPTLLLEKGWKDCVIKPVISAGGYNTFRFNSINSEYIQNYFQNYHTKLIIQPFMEEVIQEGEWSFVFFDQEYVHCVLKKPEAGQFLVQDIHGGTVSIVSPPIWMIEEAKKIIDAIEHPYLHARVDVIRKDSSLILMEIEMIEPNLFIKYFPESEKKIARKIKNKILTDSLQ